MLTQINGLHHVTAMASSASANNAFFTGTLGLRRVKKTVNFDAPDVYHLYYGDEVGTPGTVMTYFPFPDAAARQKGHGRGRADRLRRAARQRSATGRSGWRGTGPDVAHETRFGAAAAGLSTAPTASGSHWSRPRRPRPPWTGGGVDGDMAIRGFHSVTLRPRRGGADGRPAALHGLRRDRARGRA